MCLATITPKCAEMDGTVTITAGAKDIITAGNSRGRPKKLNTILSTTPVNMMPRNSTSLSRILQIIFN